MSLTLLTFDVLKMLIKNRFFFKKQFQNLLGNAVSRTYHNNDVTVDILQYSIS